MINKQKKKSNEVKKILKENYNHPNFEI